MKTKLKSEKRQSNKTHTVLVVDDDEVNYFYLEMLLNKYKGSLITLQATNGKEAVEMCKENTEISIVLMDLKMPIMDGFEATKLIKESNPNLPVIAQTSYITDDKRELAIAAGCDNFISKPISASTIYGVMDEFLKKNK